MSSNTIKTGVELINEERERQIAREGFDAKHDAEHNAGELVDAALCYAAVASAEVRGSTAEEWPVGMFNGFTDSLIEWPWEDGWWKPSNDPIRNLIKAGALIAAEIDRIQSAKTEGGAK